jgi:hypothetical protein
MLCLIFMIAPSFFPGDAERKRREDDARERSRFGRDW